MASMHKREGVRIERNKRLPPADGIGKQTREIDVLLSTEVCGYPVQWAIECKNEKKLVGSAYIDSFVGKLDYVGIPSQNGIFVSTSGYTKGAIERAKKDRIRLYLLDTALRELDATIAQALQTVIYLLPVVHSISSENFYNQPIGPADSAEVHALRAGDGEVFALVPDLLWRAWLNELFPTDLREYDVVIASPEVAPTEQELTANDDSRVVLALDRPIFMRIQDHLYRVLKVTAKVRIEGLALQLIGDISGHSLRNVSTNLIEKSQFTSRFPAAGKFDLKTLTSEGDVLEQVARPAAIKLTTRVRLPRIRYWGTFYWPPSTRVMELVAQKLRAFEAGLIPDPRPFSFAELEGTDLNTVFEGMKRGAPVTAESPTRSQAQ